MNRVELDFIRTQRRPSAWGWLLLAVGAATLVLVVSWNYVNREPRIAARQGRLAALQAALDARQPAAVKLDDKQLAAEWARAVGVAGELNLPWEKLFATVEAAADRKVALLSLEPDAVKREIVLTAEAKNFDEMLGYYKMLEEQPIFREVALHTHQVNQQDRDRPVRFRITASWMVKS